MLEIGDRVEVVGHQSRNGRVRVRQVWGVACLVVFDEEARGRIGSHGRYVNTTFVRKLSAVDALAELADGSR